MSPFIAELIGTALVVILGDGVVANVILNKSKGQNGGWMVITMGWAMAVFVGVFVTGRFGGAHLNPAVSIALATAGKFEWALVPMYIAAQMLGAILGAVIVYLVYRDHFDATPDADTKLGVFCTAPAIRKKGNNLLTEIIGTFVLILGVLYIAAPGVGLGALEALPVAFLVLALGLSLGGPTGYAINPARDLGPRIAHFLLPIKGKRDSDWGYAWVPVIGPIVGALIATFVYMSMQ
ncbi:glycerol uptake facilitator protein [Chitinophaga skermanii]|uniref:Glycerol uptake facilitator protein n=1 Tax=Chitinophaga skermanii TaxID=331697 RepID=A0A327Q5K3_9BACT|nr:MIP/aquaporin family protein [Chitinophaga skermanii]RAI99728.1 glycerol uptake facilitator protein [Chitinophaga skermanii]